MVLPMLFSILILVVIIYVAARVLGNVMWGVVLIALVFVASYLILGSFPSLKEVPVIGGWLPDLSQFPLTTGGVIGVIRGLFFNLEITNYSYTGSGNLLVTVSNSGRFDTGNFSVYVDGRVADILNNPKYPLKSGESTIIEVDWTGKFNTIYVKTPQTSANYPSD